MSIQQIVLKMDQQLEVLRTYQTARSSSFSNPLPSSSPMSAGRSTTLTPRSASTSEVLSSKTNKANRPNSSAITLSASYSFSEKKSMVLDGIAALADLLLNRGLVGRDGFNTYIRAVQECLASLCADENQDIRIAADETINRIVKSLHHSYSHVLLYAFFTELKQNGDHRTLSSSLRKFSELSVFIKPIRCKMYALSLLPVLEQICQRDEETVLTALVEGLPRIASRLLVHLPPEVNVCQVLLTSLLQRLQSDKVSTRRSIASIISIVCENVRYPIVIFQWIVDQLFAILLPVNRDTATSTVHGCFLVFRHLLEAFHNICSPGSDESSLCSLDCSLWPCLLQLGVYYAFSPDHTLATAALEMLTPLLRATPAVVLTTWMLPPIDAGPPQSPASPPPSRNRRTPSNWSQNLIQFDSKRDSNVINTEDHTDGHESSGFGSSVSSVAGMDIKARRDESEDTLSNNQQLYVDVTSGDLSIRDRAQVPSSLSTLPPVHSDLLSPSPTQSGTAADSDCFDEEDDESRPKGYKTSGDQSEDNESADSVLQSNDDIVGLTNQISAAVNLSTNQHRVSLRKKMMKRNVDHDNKDDEENSLSQSIPNSEQLSDLADSVSHSIFDTLNAFLSHTSTSRLSHLAWLLIYRLFYLPRHRPGHRVRSGVQMSSLSCLALLARLTPAAFLEEVITVSPEDTDLHTNMAKYNCLLTCIMEILNNSEDQFRGQACIVIGQLLASAAHFSLYQDVNVWLLEKQRHMVDSGNNVGYTLHQLLAVLDSILRDTNSRSGNNVKCAILALQLCANPLLASRSCTSVLSLLRNSIGQSNHTYKLVRRELIGLLGTLDYRLVAYSESKESLDKNQFRLLKHENLQSAALRLSMDALTSDDVELRRYSATSLVDIIPLLHQSAFANGCVIQATLTNKIHTVLTSDILVPGIAPGPHLSDHWDLLGPILPGLTPAIDIRPCLPSPPCQFHATIPPECGDKETIVASLNLVITSLVDRLMAVIHDKNATAGYIAALLGLIERYPPIHFPGAWGLSDTVIVKTDQNPWTEPLPNPSTSNFSSTATPNTSSSRYTFIDTLLSHCLGLMTFSNPALDISIHANLLCLTGNLILCSGLRNLMFDATTKEATEDLNEVYSSHDSHCQIFLRHIAKLLSVTWHVIQDYPAVPPGHKIVLPSLSGSGAHSSSTLRPSKRAPPDLSTSSPSTSGSGSKTKDDHSTESHPVKSKDHLGYFYSSTHYHRIYEAVNLAYQSFKISPDLTTGSDRFETFSSSLLSSLGCLLEVMPSSSLLGHTEELLAYLSTGYIYFPTETVRCVVQLLRGVFGTNVFSQWDDNLSSVYSKLLATRTPGSVQQDKVLEKINVAQIVADSSKRNKTNTREPAHQRNTGPRQTIYTSGMQAVCLEPVNLSYYLGLVHYGPDFQAKLKEASLPGAVGRNRRLATDSLFSWLRKSTDRRRPMLGVKTNNQNEKVNLGHYIGLFESIVIRSLKHYSCSSSVDLQSEILGLLCQLIFLRVNYCELDSEKRLLQLLLDQFAILTQTPSSPQSPSDSSQTPPGPTPLLPGTVHILPRLFSFLTLLTYERESPRTNQPVLSLPHLIRLGVRLFNSPTLSWESPASATVILSCLRHLVVDLFVHRPVWIHGGSLTTGTAGGHNLIPDCGVQEEMGKAREFLLESLLTQMGNTGSSRTASSAQMCCLAELVRVVVEQSAREWEEKWLIVSRSVEMALCKAMPLPDRFDDVTIVPGEEEVKQVGESREVDNMDSLLRLKASLACARSGDSDAWSLRRLFAPLPSGLTKILPLRSLANYMSQKISLIQTLLWYTREDALLEQIREMRLTAPFSGTSTQSLSNVLHLLLPSRASTCTSQPDGLFSCDTQSEAEAEHNEELSMKSAVNPEKEVIDLIFQMERILSSSLLISIETFSEVDQSQRDTIRLLSRSLASLNLAVQYILLSDVFPVIRKAAVEHIWNDNPNKAYSFQTICDTFSSLVTHEPYLVTQWSQITALLLVSQLNDDSQESSTGDLEVQPCFIWWNRMLTQSKPSIGGNSTAKTEADNSTTTVFNLNEEMVRRTTLITFCQHLMELETQPTEEQISFFITPASIPVFMALFTKEAAVKSFMKWVHKSPGLSQRFIQVLMQVPQNIITLSRTRLVFRFIHESIVMDHLDDLQRLPHLQSECYDWLKLHQCAKGLIDSQVRSALHKSAKRKTSLTRTLSQHKLRSRDNSPVGLAQIKPSMSTLPFSLSLPMEASQECFFSLVQQVLSQPIKFDSHVYANLIQNLSPDQLETILLSPNNNQSPSANQLPPYLLDHCLRLGWQRTTDALSSPEKLMTSGAVKIDDLFSAVEMVLLLTIKKPVSLLSQSPDLVAMCTAMTSYLDLLRHMPLRVAVPDSSCFEICQFLVDVMLWIMDNDSSLSGNFLATDSLLSLLLSVLRTHSLTAVFASPEFNSKLHIIVEFLYRVSFSGVLCDVGLPKWSVNVCLNTQQDTTASSDNDFSSVSRQQLLHLIDLILTENSRLKDCSWSFRNKLKLAVIGISRLPFYLSHLSPGPLTDRYSDPSTESDSHATAPPTWLDLSLPEAQDAEILHTAVARMALLGWTSPRHFQEIWTCLLQMVQPHTEEEDELVSEELVDRNQCRMLALRSLTRLLLSASLNKPEPGNPLATRAEHWGRDGLPNFTHTRLGGKLTTVRSLVDAVLMDCLGGRDLDRGGPVTGELEGNLERIGGWNWANPEGFNCSYGPAQIRVDLLVKRIVSAVRRATSISSQPTNLDLSTKSSPTIFKSEGSKESNGRLDTDSCLRSLPLVHSIFLASPAVTPATSQAVDNPKPGSFIPMALRAASLHSLVVLSDLFTTQEQVMWAMDTLKEVGSQLINGEDELLLAPLIRGMGLLSALCLGVAPTLSLTSPTTPGQSSTSSASITGLVESVRWTEAALGHPLVIVQDAGLQAALALLQQNNSSDGPHKTELTNLHTQVISYIEHGLSSLYSTQLSSFTMSPSISGQAIIANHYGNKPVSSSGPGVSSASSKASSQGRGQMNQTLWWSNVAFTSSLERHSLILLASAVFYCEHHPDALRDSDLLSILVTVARDQLLPPDNLYPDTRRGGISVSELKDPPCSPAIYLTLFKGLERLILTEKLPRLTVEVLIKLAMDRLRTSHNPQICLPALSLFLTGLYTTHASSVDSLGQQGKTKNNSEMVEFDSGSASLERVLALVTRLSQPHSTSAATSPSACVTACPLPLETGLIAHLVPALLVDCGPPSQALNRCIAYFLSHKPASAEMALYPRLAADVLFQVFEKLTSEGKSEVDRVCGWVLQYLETLVQKEVMCLAIWNATVFFSAFSVNPIIKAIFPLVRANQPIYAENQVNMPANQLSIDLLCLSGLDWFISLKSSDDRQTFLKVLAKAQAESPFSLLYSLTNKSLETSTEQ